jgi:hypothetical protein
MTDILIGGQDYIAVLPDTAAHFSPAITPTVPAGNVRLVIKDYFRR